jgi:hypothetical protein
MAPPVYNRAMPSAPLVSLVVCLVLLGAAAALLAHGWWPGRLPGDFTVRWRDGTLYVPLASSLLLTALILLVLAALRR